MTRQTVVLSVHCRAEDSKVGFYMLNCINLAEENVYKWFKNSRIK